MTAMAPLAFEVVYHPQEIRVYIYGPGQQPQSARDVEGEVGLRRQTSSRTFTATLQYVAPPPGSSEQDYLAVKAKLSGVQDGEMLSTFTLKNLPLQRPTATFGQPVAVSKPKPQVTLAALDQGDEAGIARQRVCPVTGAALDSMGSPVKVLVGGQALYLCCKGCLAKVQSAPEAYLRKASQVGQVQ
jgi:YHS domain-containing protein